MKYDQSLILKKNGSNCRAQIIGRTDEHSGIRRRSSMRIGSGESRNDERSANILEIDTGKSYFTQKCRNLFHSTHRALDSDHQSQSLTNSKDPKTHRSNRSLVADDVEESLYYTANNSPQVHSASSMQGSRRSPFTPTSDGSRSCLSGYFKPKLHGLH